MQLLICFQAHFHIFFGLSLVLCVQWLSSVFHLTMSFKMSSVVFILNFSYLLYAFRYVKFFVLSVPHPPLWFYSIQFINKNCFFSLSLTVILLIFLSKPQFFWYCLVCELIFQIKWKPFSEMSLLFSDNKEYFIRLLLVIVSLLLLASIRLREDSPFLFKVILRSLLKVTEAEWILLMNFGNENFL